MGHAVILIEDFRSTEKTLRCTGKSLCLHIIVDNVDFSLDWLSHIVTQTPNNSMYTYVY